MSSYPFWCSVVSGCLRLKNSSFFPIPFLGSTQLSILGLIRLSFRPSRLSFTHFTHFGLERTISRWNIKSMVLRLLTQRSAFSPVPWYHLFGAWPLLDFSHAPIRGMEISVFLIFTGFSSCSVCIFLIASSNAPRSSIFLTPITCYVATSQGFCWSSVMISRTKPPIKFSPKPAQLGELCRTALFMAPTGPS